MGSAQCLELTASTPGEHEISHLVRTVANAFRSSWTSVQPPVEGDFEGASNKEPLIVQHGKKLFQWATLASKNVQEHCGSWAALVARLAPQHRQLKHALSFWVSGCNAHVLQAAHDKQCLLKNIMPRHPR